MKTLETGKTRFIHLRFWNEDGLPQNRGGTTIAYKADPDNLNTFNVAYSICHPNENYCRKIGRNITEGRLHSGDCYHILFDPFVSSEFSTSDGLFDFITEWVNNRITRNYTQQQEENHAED